MLGMAKPRKSSENHTCPQRKLSSTDSIELCTDILRSYTLSMNTAVIFLAAANADQITFIEIDSFHIVLVIAAIAVSVLYTNFATVTRLTRLILALSTVVVFGAVLVLAHSQDSLSAQPHEPPTTTTSVSGHAAPTMFVQKPGAYRATEF